MYLYLPLPLPPNKVTQKGKTGALHLCNVLQFLLPFCKYLTSNRLSNPPLHGRKFWTVVLLKRFQCSRAEG